MKSPHRPIFGLLLLALLASPLRAQTSKPEDDGHAAIDSWLALFDAGQYDATWTAASSGFQSLVAKTEWTTKSATMRKALGALESRKLIDIKFTRAMPDAPAGEYVLAHFDSAFAARKGLVETVVATLDKDKTWKVCGYFIKTPAPSKPAAEQ